MIQKEKIDLKVGQMMRQISYRQAKKPWNSRLFPVDLDAPYM
ncbi:hypothetical protein QP481_00395 [Streptococcus oralis]|nr:hypothetical protein [Streptococcus oralis]MDK7310423.1 hypothetical protein [Streptococcus oralis]